MRKFLEFSRIINNRTLTINKVLLQFCTNYRARKLITIEAITPTVITTLIPIASQEGFSLCGNATKALLSGGEFIDIVETSADNMLV